MASWLFNSSGIPIAFVDGNNVFSAVGEFVGRLDGNEVWNGGYIGEIVRDVYLLHKTQPSRG
jgi:hypothetical protein